MAGLTAGAPTPQSITVHEQSRVLELVYSDGAHLRIPFELMRVYSPSAEVMGHGPGQEVLQTGKRDVCLVDLQPVGNYAIQPTFSDGHGSGIYTWAYLYELGRDQDALWQRYLQRLQDAGLERDAPMLPKAQKSACSGH
ncbi:gamma-butyrobetaine hydroxylase-like domain-containing protein [Alicycliphilus denitrificans]|uniref:gamma-butyrobetaine hydroxylase-like domain-containing protein n=1 Tax=Alicycliphilus denitrificans TaxID=179636 RepID=UPI00384C1819